MRYTWTLASKPANSNAKIDAPEGTVETSLDGENATFEFRYLSETETPTLVPDLPGDYELSVTVETIGEDAVTQEVEVTAQYTATLRVAGNGEPADAGENGTYGCSTNLVGGSVAHVAILLLAGVGLLGRRRRRA